MNSMLLAGLTDHEAAAIEIMIGMNWQDQRVLTIPRGLGLGVPEQSAAAKACEQGVLDLFGFGMRRHTPEHEAKLIEFLAGRSAVLLVWGCGGGWLERQLPLARGQRVAWVSMPYTSADMLAAIKQVRVERVAPAAEAPKAAAARPALRRNIAAAQLTPAAPARAPASAPATDVPVPAWRRAMELAEQLRASASVAKPAGRGTTRARPADAAGLPELNDAVLVMPPNVPRALNPTARSAAAGPAPTSARPPVGRSAPAVAPAPPSMDLSSGALQAVMDVFPALTSIPLVLLSERILAGHGAQLLRVGGDAAFITHVEQGWLASGLPISALLKMLHTPQLVERMEIAPLPAYEVEETLRQLFGGRFHRAQAPLDVIMWELMGSALKDLALVRRGDLSFRLHRFPNFTLLQDIGPLDIQLASICARMSQSLSDLVRAFPRHEAEVYRFVALCVLSGLAGVTQVVPAGHGTARSGSVLTPPAAPTKPAAQTAARRGFFKSLLDKLF